MHLEKLEVIGFKSFAEKTEFLFEPGLTAVVGPNGCGKSNVVDAIKWVLGEQSVKSLRGSEMSDVIFNGTTSRKSLGYAEVSLLFSNTQNLLPVDYEQVRVTRRLYRTGESEYFLNKTQCRLRDIRELFMGTGVGMNAYCVIEQGKIDVLLQANPQERRIIFEEASGISKYKTKKKMALNKLERVEHNLLRLSDIIVEIRRTMESLHRQAGKARRYREYTHRLKELKTLFAIHRYHLFSVELEGTQAELGTAVDSKGAQEALKEKLDAESSSLSTLAVELDQSVLDMERLKMEIGSRIQGCEGERDRAKERIREAKGELERLQVEIGKAAARLDEIKAELVRTTEEMEDTEEEILKASRDFDANQQAIRDLADEAALLGRQIQNQRASIIDVLNERSGYNNERTLLEGHRNLLDTQMKKNRERRQKVEDELRELAMLRRETEEAIASLSGQLQDAMARLAQTQGDILRVQESQMSIDERLSGQQKQLTSKESRRDLLQDLERRREGMGTGVKQVLSAVQQQPQQLQGVVGTVAEILQVDVEYALAIEAALAAAAQALVTDKTEHTLSALEFLRSGDRGRATFLPLDRIQENGHDQPEKLDHPSYIGRAIDFVHADDTHRAALVPLLSETYLVRDFQAALALAPLLPHSSRVITLEGDIVCASGAITGGGAVDRLGIISRKSELRQLEIEITQTRQRMLELSGERDQTLQRLADLRSLQETVQNEISDLNVKRVQKQSALDQALQHIVVLEQEQQVLSAEIADFQQQLARNADQRGQMDQLIAATETRESEFNQGLSSLEEQQTQMDAKRETLSKSGADLQASQARLKEKWDNLRSARVAATRVLNEQKELLVARHGEVEQWQARELTSQNKIQEMEGTLQQLFQDQRQKEEEIRTLRNRREELRLSADQNAAELDAANTALRTLEGQVHELRLKESQAQLKMENLVQQARADQDLSLAEAYSRGSHSEDKDWEAVQTEIESLESSVRKLGNVYEDAIEEYEKEELRAQSLTTQEQDLLQAKTKLQEIIKRINRTSRRLFETTFQSVRENFQVIFAKLFGGGKADIFLEEGVDILEAGIEIVARPPGKSENTVLSLLSGGEKALCTIALLFAIFRSRPSPFCILDEVDAPLDESNIDRFVNLLLEFNRNTQFIIITHNRRTMRVADSIYGITMQEPGVSSKVSVRFEQIEE